MSAEVPFLDIASQQAEIAAEVLAVWEAQFASAAFIGGPEVSAFEDEYAAYIGVEHVVGVSNGTDALELALRAVGVAPGDEVIIPANTFIATAEAVSRIGASPVLVDVDAVHLLIDPDAVEAAITPRTRAIAPVHLFGQTAPMELIQQIADRRGIAVVEDPAQSQGASSTAGRAGALGRVAGTSFYPGKNLGAAGDAGAVMTNDADIAAFVRNVAAHGRSVKYAHDRIGMNARLDAVQAPVLRAKLRRLDAWNAARRAAAARYGELLADIDGVRAPVVRPGNEDVWHLYVVQVDARDRVMAQMNKAGVGVALHYPTPIHLTEAYAGLGYGRGQFPVSEAAADHILSLPMFPHLTDDFVEGASLWGVSKSYLSAAREQNLRAADLVLAVTPELARHLQRRPASPRWLPNGADLERFTGIDGVAPADVPLQPPIVGVVGQFNSRTDLNVLEAVRRAGSNLLLVGPRWFVAAGDNAAFDRLIGLPGVHWVDEVPREQLAPYLRILQVGLTPYADSMFNRRSYPLKTLEYLAAGVPVVSTDVASLCGLDHRYVSAESSTTGFCERVGEVAKADLEPSDIRRSVESDGWDSRAGQLLAWLSEEGGS